MTDGDPNESKSFYNLKQKYKDLNSNIPSATASNASGGGCGGGCSSCGGGCSSCGGGGSW